MPIKARLRLTLAATLILVTGSRFIQLRCSDESTHSGGTMLASWYTAGVAAKFIVGTLLDEIRDAHDKQLQTQLEHDKNALTPEKLKARQLELKRDKEEFKTRTDAVSKMVIGTLKLLLIASYEHSGAALETIAPISNAFNSGLKLWILGRTIGRPLDTIKQLMAFKSTLPFEFVPIKPTHGTAWYCGPKDPYCLHDARQETIDETVAQISTEIGSWMTVIADVATGIACAYLGAYTGKAVVALTSKIGITLLPLVETIGLHAPGTISNITSATTKIIQKGIKRYVSVETRTQLKRWLLDLIYSPELSPARSNADTDIKYGFNVRTVGTKVLPAHLKFIEDFIKT